MALKRIDNKATLTFNDYVSRTFIGILENTKYNFNQKYLSELTNEIDLIIKENYPIIRYQKSKEEVLKLYKEIGYEDKYNVLQYREDATVHFYSCDGYIDYMYGYMLPSTGYIKDIQLEANSSQTPYEPYKESITTIPLLHDMCSLPNGTRDRIYYSNVYKYIVLPLNIHIQIMK